MTDNIILGHIRFLGISHNFWNIYLLIHIQHKEDLVLFLT